MTIRTQLKHLVAVIALFSGLAAPGLATPVLAGDAVAPLGYMLFCLQTPAECRPGGKDHVALNDGVLDIIKLVNARVNRSIRPRHDSGADIWSINVSAGDCEDYVLTKRHALIAAGLPPSALRIGYVKTRAGEGHAILIIKTNSHDLVLDNLVGNIRPLSQTGYRLISSSGANPLAWS